MAGVEAESEVAQYGFFADPAGVGRRQEPPGDEKDEFVRGLNGATGFGFDGQLDELALAQVDAVEMMHGVQHPVHDRAGIAFKLQRGPVCAGKRADAAGHAVRQQSRKMVRQLQRVGQPLPRSPVRFVHMIFNMLVVELAPWKPVDREYIEMVIVEVLLQFLDPAGLRQLARGLAAQSQAQPERPAGGNPLMNRLRRAADRGEILIPPFAGVDIQAIGQVQWGLGLNTHLSAGK